MIKINGEFIENVSLKAKAAPRRRINHNFHPFPEDTLQRMLNAMEPDTYIQPHKHENPDKTEVFFCLRGKMLVVEYHDDGSVADFIILDSNSGNFGCEIAPRIYHNIICLESGSVAYEVKDGPYNPLDDKHFAPWAPSENDKDAIEFNEKLLKQLKISL
jgi:cupin fold WbuC family metalloprotein